MSISVTLLLEALQEIVDIENDTIDYAKELASSALHFYKESADAPSEPSKAVIERAIRFIESGSHTQIARDTMTNELRKLLKSRAADALDSRPTEPEKMTTDQSREYLVKFMEQHFTDKTYHRYIRGERGAVNLAGDFAWQMARALRMIQPSTAKASSQPTAPMDGCEACDSTGGSSELAGHWIDCCECKGTGVVPASSQPTDGGVRNGSTFVPPVAAPLNGADRAHETSYALGWNAARKYVIDNLIIKKELNNG